ncbi:hypothetical protein SAMN03159343_0167 [Klenkia marina]|uniref:Uncharacterized protein n=1 Tax=Klenkia marina TaxID=1960309 RepID=A0A1G4X8Y6_9ACTN|nr:hypothetical protein SAMN03159343_0167 [Klenkia marina]
MPRLFIDLVDIGLVPTSCLLPGDLLVSRIHVDLGRVTTAGCPAR